VTLWAYIKLVFRGRRIHAATGDMKQLGGDVLIDPRGIVRMHYISSGPDDRPAVSSLIETVRLQTEEGKTDE